MITIYMDENVHGAITQALRARGLDVLRVQEDGFIGYPDDEILARANVLNRLLFSQDDDLLREARKCQQQGIAFYGVAYAHQLDVSIGQCVNDLEFLARAGRPGDFINQVYYLPL